MINQAIQFATICHRNQVRKGTQIPYILHCLEAGTIAANLTNEGGNVDSEVVAAAILHDTVEDAYVSYATLKEVFNERVADLVRYQSEDKSKTWKERKQATIHFLQENQSKAVEIALLSDKLSNIRSIAKDYAVQNEALWNKFNAGKEQQHWYYRSIGESLTQLQETAEYKEYHQLVRQVFESNGGL